MKELTTPRGKRVLVDEVRVEWLTTGIERAIDPGTSSIGHEALKALCLFVGTTPDERWALLRYAKEELLEEYTGAHDLKRYRLLH